MTPDFLVGLLIGSFAIYACWLFSLRPEPFTGWAGVPDTAEQQRRDAAMRADPASIPACPECRPGEPHFADCPVQDRVLAALLVLGEELSDGR